MSNDIALSDVLLDVTEILTQIAVSFDQPDNSTLANLIQQIRPIRGHREVSIIDIAKRVLRCRKARRRHLPDVCFGEPAWDMLLDLFVQRAEGNPVSIKSAQYAAQVPGTTALRYIDVLIAEGLIAKRPAPGDKRVSYLSLTRTGVERVTACLIDQATPTELANLHNTGRDSLFNFGNEPQMQDGNFAVKFE